MDIMDLASKGIAAIARNFGKKIRKEQGEAPAIEQLKPTVISGNTFRAGFAREEIMPDLSDKNKIIFFYCGNHKMRNVTFDFRNQHVLFIIWCFKHHISADRAAATLLAFFGCAATYTLVCGHN